MSGAEVEGQRDAGLLRAVGPTALAASIICQTVGATIFVVPATLAATLGVYAPLALLGCGVAIGAIAICFAEGGSRIPTSGGPYGYIEAAFGPLVGYIVGTLLWVGNVLACGGVAAALGDVGASLSGPSLGGPVRALTIVGAVGSIAAVNIAGVTRGAGLVKLATAVKLLPLAVFVLCGAPAMHAANFSHSAMPAEGGLGRAVILALFAYTGLEVALSASGEVAQPNRTIPRALAIAMPSIMGLYIAIQIVAQGILGDALAHSGVPLADAMAPVGAGLRTLMVGGAAVSMFGMLSSDLMGSPRQLFAFGREGLLPAVLGRVHARSRAPYMAIATYAALAAGLALTGSFARLAVLATLAVVPVYAAGCASAWLLARRRIALAGTPLGFSFLGTAASTGIVSMLLLASLAERADILGVGALMIASALVYLIQTRAVVARE